MDMSRNCSDCSSKCHEHFAESGEFSTSTRNARWNCIRQSSAFRGLGQRDGTRSYCRAGGALRTSASGCVQVQWLLMNLHNRQLYSVCIRKVRFGRQSAFLIKTLIIDTHFRCRKCVFRIFFFTHPSLCLKIQFSSNFVFKMRFSVISCDV